jgi:hypothetical protein
MAEGQNLADLLKEGGYGNNEFLEKLPLSQKKRVCALKKIQLASIEVEAEFYERVHQLEKEFEAKFNQFYDQRKKIVAGTYEPTDAETDLPLIHGLEEEDLKRIYDASEPDNGEKGVVDFWLQVLRGSDVISDMIQEHDEPILKHLIDVTSSVEMSPPGFTLYFHFSPNSYFKNTVLKKHYELHMKPESDDPFEYDGPTVFKATGDEIQWEEGKNITKKVVKKKAKKGANAGKFLTKTVDNESFFNFFSPPQVEEQNEDDENDEDFAKGELQRADFEVGQVIRDHIIPRAVLFFTGEADLGDDMLDFGDEEDEDDISDEEDDE